MEDFSLPEDLAALAAEDIQELIEAARDEFHTLNDSDSLEDETLDRMTVLADAIDALHDDFVSKVELAVSRRDAISVRVFGNATTVTFNLDNLNSASDHVEQAIDALEQVEPDISSALSEAKSAETILKSAVKGGAAYNRRVGPRTAPVGVGIGVYKADTEEFNIKYTTGALDDVSDAIDALNAGNVDAALDNLNDAADELDNSIDSYDNDVDEGPRHVRVSGPGPGPGPSPAPGNGYASDDAVELDADTEEFASCSSARRRVRVARRSLRKALTAVRNCSGTRVVYVDSPPPSSPPPPAPPAPGMSVKGVEFAVTKGEVDGDYPASDFAYVPDPQHPSTWKLRLTSTPGGDPDARIVGTAVAALGKGFRGNVVQLAAEDRPKVVEKVRAAWLKANSEKTESDLPSVLRK